MYPQPFNRDGAGHTQRHIEHGGRQADVDEGLADLVLAAWRNGIDTIYSCENVEGWAWLYVPDAENAHKFQAIGGDLVQGEATGRPHEPYHFWFRPEATSELTDRLNQTSH